MTDESTKSMAQKFYNKNQIESQIPKYWKLLADGAIIGEYEETIPLKNLKGKRCG